MSEAVQILTPIGRLVQGHPMEVNPVLDDKTKQQKKNLDGTPMTQIYVGIAFAKSDPAFMRDVWPQMQAVAQRDWPRGEFNSPTFAWKVVDGDGKDRKGQPYASREGFAGAWVLKISSGYAYQVVAPPQENNVPIVDKNRIKRGYYVRAYVNIKGNSPSQTPGLYVNPSFVQLMAYGPEITSGPDVAAILAQAGAAPALPPGASLTPVGNGTGIATGAPGLPLPSGAAPGLPMPINGTVPGMAGPPPVVGMVAAPPPPPIAFPPAGWTLHPSAPGHYYRGQEVMTEAQLRALPIQPHPGILAPPQ